MRSQYSLESWFDSVGVTLRASLFGSFLQGGKMSLKPVLGVCVGVYWGSFGLRRRVSITISTQQLGMVFPYRRKQARAVWSAGRLLMERAVALAGKQIAGTHSEFYSVLSVNDRCIRSSLQLCSREAKQTAESKHSPHHWGPRCFALDSGAGETNVHGCRTSSRECLKDTSNGNLFCIGSWEELIPLPVYHYQTRPASWWRLMGWGGGGGGGDS